jgi:V/A-type H+/Na+-transporting ATPase subunit K
MKKFAAWLSTILLAAGMLASATAFAAEPATAGVSSEQWQAYQRIGLGAAAAFAVAVGIIGAGYAVAKIGSAALGAAVEKPELLIRSLLFIALAEGLAVLGFAVAMMLMQKM